MKYGDKKMGDGGKAKQRLMQYMASGGMTPMDPKMAKHGMKVTDGGVMVKIMPMEDGGAVKKMKHGGKHPKEIKGAKATQVTQGEGYEMKKEGPITSFIYDPEGMPGRSQTRAGKQGAVPRVTAKTIIADTDTTGSKAGQTSYTTIRAGIGGGRRSTSGQRAVSTTITPENVMVRERRGQSARRGEQTMTARQVSDKRAARMRSRMNKQIQDIVASAKRQGTFSKETKVPYQRGQEYERILPPQTARPENIAKAKRKGSKGLKALAAKNPKLKYVGKDGMKMPGGGHVFKKAQEGTKVTEGNRQADAKKAIKFRQDNIDRLKREKAGIQAGGSSTGAKALAGDAKFKDLVGLSSISSSAVSKLHAGYDALIAAEQKQLANAMKAAERPPMYKKGDLEKTMARAAKQ